MSASTSSSKTLCQLLKRMSRTSRTKRKHVDVACEEEEDGKEGNWKGEAMRYLISYEAKG
jgi:hypothetical protein